MIVRPTARFEPKLKGSAALPPDVRKGSAFPKDLCFRFWRGYASNAEA
jgi:hypothetical protein